ncbi:hypothetical protein M406DRAFT_322669 [Cryphonectria parasitica EP155]|uniref:Uncharacterized protein n=1 Tax=Cryphonectria parasitica (strain ATCC 38755 / EP155) TaxID=660469 RepID=A0A9P4Y0B2_CRYP1|nr:uncharacterized protein M406DRAFT_322669 [Cryphonectria parasitica EP155]KAF3764632.1 hypothetical protein M406DRAFT_322669 [Cryphonectria parasitica EP155]
MSCEGDTKQAPLYMGFDAFSAASFLNIAEDIHETNTDDDISEKVYKRYVPKIIEDDPASEGSAAGRKSPEAKNS